MRRSTQRKMLRLFVQTKRNEEDEEEEKASHRRSDKETAEGSGSNTDSDQDSDISYMTDTDEEIDTGETDEKDRIDCMRRSTSITEERMKTATIPCWVETHRRMKWRLAVRIASLPDERRTKKAAKWNPGLSTKHQTNRTVRRPKKRWEDEINDSLKPEETEETKVNEIKNNDTWIKICKKS